MKHGWLRTVLFLCAVCLTATLAGCFGGENGGDTPPAATTAATTATTATAAPTAEATAPAYPFTAYVNATTLHVRPTADTAGESIGGLKFGDEITVTGREGDWYCIAFKGGIGYVNAQYVQETLPTATEPVVTTATDTAADVVTTAAVAP